MFQVVLANFSVRCSQSDSGSTVSTVSKCFAGKGYITNIIIVMAPHIVIV